MEPAIVELFLRMSCLRRGNAVAGGSSGIVTVYECRILGIINKILPRCININFKKQLTLLWTFSHQIFQGPSGEQLDQETTSSAVRGSTGDEQKHRALTDSLH